jgi:non-ribosomal peptide synthetase component F
VNTLVMRTQVSNELTFRELLAKVREVSLEAYAHQDMPFEKLVEELNPDRELNRNPFVDVMFAFQNTPRVVLQLYDATVSQFDIDNGIARFDLQLYMEEINGRLSGYLSYNTDLFHEQTIVRMAERFSALIENIIADPEQRISEFTLLTANEAAPASDTELTQMLGEIEAMTEEAAQQMLTEKRAQRTEVDGHE